MRTTCGKVVIIAEVASVTWSIPHPLFWNGSHAGEETLLLFNTIHPGTLSCFLVWFCLECCRRTSNRLPNLSSALSIINIIGNISSEIKFETILFRSTTPSCAHFSRHCPLALNDTVLSFGRAQLLQQSAVKSLTLRGWSFGRVVPFFEDSSFNFDYLAVVHDLIFRYLIIHD